MQLKLPRKIPSQIGYKNNYNITNNEKYSQKYTLYCLYIYIPIFGGVRVMAAWD